MKYECSIHLYRGDYLPCPWPSHADTPDELRILNTADDFASHYAWPDDEEAVADLPVNYLAFRRVAVNVGTPASLGGYSIVYRWVSV